MMRLNLSLLLCLLFALASMNHQGVEAKTLVRGSSQRHQSPYETVRVLKKAKDEDDDKDEPAAAKEKDEEDEEEPEDDEKDEKDPEDDESDIVSGAVEAPSEVTGAPEEVEGEETTAAPTETAEAEETEPEETTDSGSDTTTTETETAAPTEPTPETVTLQPFAIMIEGGEITEAQLDMDDYLEDALGATDVELVLIEPVMEETNSSRFLKDSDVRFLQETTMDTFYYEGTATFAGAAPEDVNALVTAALEDSEALTAHVDLPNITVTGSPNTNADGSQGSTTVDSATSESTSTSDESDGLTTTGLAIVIVAACVGGISLMIIVLVGATGPSGSTAQLK